jgi:uncharacterized protein (TIGR03435 family)
MMKPGASAIFLAANFAASLIGQKAAPARFEVASVKPSPATASLVAKIDPARLTLAAYPLRQMICAAYGLRSSELLGGPAWIASAKYDITAKAEKPATGPELWAMMRPLLEDRFRLKMHVEKKQFDVYNLSIATRGKLPAATPGRCLGSDPTAVPAAPESGKAVVFPCNTLRLQRKGTNAAQIAGGAVRMARFAGLLTDLLGRPVIDNTGYAAAFDVQLNFAFYGFGQLVPNAKEPNESASDPAGLPNIVEAIRRQYGLRLESGKALRDVHVIDSIERPSGN